MARQVKDFNEDAFGKKRGKYPWDKWFNGRVWELIPGEDFFVDNTRLRTTFVYEAKKHGGKCLFTVVDGKVYIKFVPNKEGG